MLRKLLIGTVSLFALFAVAGSALFFATPSSAHVDRDNGHAVESEHSFGRFGQRGHNATGNHPRGKKGGVLSPAEKAVVIADTLGITVEEVRAAREDGIRLPELAEANGVEMDVVGEALYVASVDKVNTMVADGEITQEQADQIVAKIELHKLAHEIFDRSVIQQVIADTLGVTVEELEAAHEAGTVKTLAESAGVTRKDIKAAIEVARDSMIDDAVASGQISAEQAEQLRELPMRRFGHGGHKGHGQLGG